MKPKFAFFALIFNFYFCSSKCSVEENHYISVFSCIDLNVFEYPYLVKERIVGYVYSEPVDYNIFRPFWAVYTENYIWCFTRPGIYYVTLLCPDDTYELVYIHAEQPSVSILVDPKYPVTIGDYFSLNISLSNNGLSEFIYFEFELILVGCDSDENFSNYLYGQRNIITISNSAIFSSLRIKKSGNFCLKSIIKINVLGWDVDDRQIYKTIIKSSDLIIYSKITDIDLSCDSGLQQYYSNLCNLTVKGDNQTEYLDGFTITLDFDQPVETLEWPSQILIYDSYINFKIYSKNYGLLSATARLVELTTGNSFTKTIYKDIQNAVLLIDSVSDSSSRVSFEISARIDYFWGGIIDINVMGIFDLELMIMTSKYSTNSGLTFTIGDEMITGAYTLKIDSNPFKIKNIKVLSSGYFYFILNATSVNIPASQTNSFKAINFVNEVQIFHDYVVNNYKMITLNLDVTGDDWNKFLGPLNITINEISDIGIVGNLNQEFVSNNLPSVLFYFLGSGSAKVMCNVNDLTKIIYFTVQPCYLKINLNPTPLNTDFFSACVSINDMTDTAFISIYFQIKLTLIKTGNTSGNITAGIWEKGFYGSYCFENLKILSSGSFKIQVSSTENLTSAESENIYIANRILYAKLVTTYPERINVYKTFSIDVELIGEDYLPFIGECNIEINQPYGVVWFEKEKKCSGTNRLSFQGYFTIQDCFIFQITTNYSSQKYILSEEVLCSTKSLLHLSIEMTVRNIQGGIVGSYYNIILGFTDFNFVLLKNANFKFRVECNITYLNREFHQFYDIDIYEGRGISQPLRFTRQGSYIFSASWEYFGEFTTYFFYVYNYVSNINIWLNPANFSILTNVTINIEVLGADGNNLLDESFLTVQDSSGTNLQNIIITDGFFTTITHVKDLDYYVFAECNYFRKELSVKVSPLKLKVTLTNTPNTSTDVFGVFLGVYDDFEGLKCDFRIFLYLESIDNYNSGLVTYDMQQNIQTNGENYGGYSMYSSCFPETVGYFKVLSSGVFRMNAISLDFDTNKIISIPSEIFKISNQILYIFLGTENTRVSILQPIELFINLIGEDFNRYIDYAEIKIYNNSENILNCSYVNGKSTCFYTPLVYGNYNLTAKANITESSISFEVVRLELIPWILIIPETSSTSLLANFTIKDIFNKTKNFNEITQDCYVFLELLQISDNSGGIINGTLSKKVYNSGVIFNENFILSSGLFILRFSSSCESIINEYTTPIFSVRNSVKQININLSDLEVSVYSEFSLNISINGLDDKLYLYECILFITDQYNTFWADQLINNGTGIINLFLTETKEYNLRTSCGGVESNIINVTPIPLSFDVNITDFNGNFVKSTDSKETIYANIRVINSKGLVESKNYEYGTYPFTLSLLNNSMEYSGLTFQVFDDVYDNISYTGFTDQGYSKLHIKVLSSGNFTIKIFNSFIPINTKSLTVLSKNHIKNYSIFPSIGSIYFATTLLINLVGDDNYPLKSPIKIYIMDYSNTSYNCINYEGECKIQDFIVINLGTNNFIINSIDLNSNFSFTGLPIKLSALPSKNVSTSNESFDLVFSLVDYIMGTEICHKYLSSCTYQLSIIPIPDILSSGNVLESNSMENVNCATFNYSGVKILSYGNFQLIIKSSCLFIDTWISPYTISIINYPRYIYLTPTTSIVTAYFSFTLNVTVKGDDKESYYNDTLISIQDQNGNVWAEKKININSTNINLFLNDTKTFELRGYYNKEIFSNSIQLKPNPLSFDLDLINTRGVSVNSTQSSETYYVKIKVTNSQGVVESNNYKGYGLYPFTLSLNPLNQKSSENSAIFNNTKSDIGIYNGTLYKGESTIELKILSSGDFALSLESQSELLIPKKSLIIKSTNQLKYFTNNISTTTVYLSTNLTLTLYGDDDKLFKQSLEVRLINSLNQSDNYTCQNFEGECKITGLLLTMLGFNYFYFISNDLNHSLAIEGTSINIVPDIPFENITKSNETFDLVIRLKDINNNLVYFSDYLYNCDVNLNLMPQMISAYSGLNITFESKTRNEPGLIKFKSVKILSSGEFSFNLSSNCNFINSAVTPFKFTIKNYPKSISTSFSKFLTVNEYFFVTVEVFGDDDNIYHGSCSIFHSSSLISIGSDLLYSGFKKNFTFYYETEGFYNPFINCSQEEKVASSNLYNEVFKQSLSLKFLEIPSDSKPFSLQVCLLDRNLNRLDSFSYFNKETRVDLTLINSNFSYSSGLNLTGVLQKKIEFDFCVTFSGIKILSSGNFSILAETNTSNVNSNQTDFFLITNTITEFDFTFSRSLFTFFSFSLIISPKGEDKKLFILPTSYELSSNDGSLSGSLSSITSGKVEFNKLFFTLSGQKIIFVKTTFGSTVFNDSIRVSVSRSRVDFNVFGLPITSNDLFYVTASIVDDNNLTESENGPYDYSLNININESLPFSSRKGVQNIYLARTIANFTELMIKSYGTYWISVSVAQDILLQITQNFQVLNMIKNFTLTSLPRIASYEDLQVNAMIYGVDDELFLIDSNFSLIHNSSQIVSFESFNSRNTGNFNFTLFFRKDEIVSFSLYATFDKYYFNSSILIVDVYRSILIPASNLKEIITGEKFNFSFQLVDDFINGKILENFNNFMVNIEFICIESPGLVNCSNFDHNGSTSAISRNGQVIFQDLIIYQNSLFIIKAIPQIISFIDSNKSDQLLSFIEPSFKLEFVPDVKPSKSTDTFSIYIFSYYGNYFALKDVPFNFSFSHLNNSLASGEVLQGNFLQPNKTDNLGILTLKNLRILSSGEFIFKVFFQGNLKGSLFTDFVQNYIKSIELTTEKSSNEYSSVVLNYKTIGDDNNLFILPVNISISEAKNLRFKINSFTNSSSGSFNLTLLEKNDYTFIISNNITIDKVKISLSYSNNNLCKKKNMKIDEKNESCICDLNFFLNETLDECLPCHDTCKVCYNQSSCKECKLKNSSPLNGECKCNEGFFFDGENCSICYDGCRICKSNNACEECLVGYKKPENYCKCPDIEHMNENCECHDGYELINLITCSKCKRWIQKNDITITLIENYNVIQIDINSSLILNQTLENFKDLIINKNILGIDFRFVINSENSFRIELGEYNTIFSNSLILNLSNFYAENEICNFTRVQIPQKFIIFTEKEKPSPQAVIFQNFSTDNLCDDNKVHYSFDGKYSKGNFKNDLNYLFKVFDSTDSKSPLITSTDSNIEFDIDRKQNIKSFIVELSVETYFNTKDLSQLKIDVNYSQKLFPQIENIYRCWYSIECQIMLDNLISCIELDQLSYEWEIFSGNNKKFSSKSSVLIIPAKVLEAKNYDFSLKISSGEEILSVSNGTLEIIPDKPRIYIDRVQGSINKYSDLILIPKEKSSTLGGLQETDLNPEISLNWNCKFPDIEDQEWTKCRNQSDGQKNLNISKNDLENIKNISVWLNATLNSLSTSIYFQANIIDEDVPLVKFKIFSKGFSEKFPQNSSTIIEAFSEDQEIHDCKFSLKDLNEKLLKNEYQDCQITINPTILKLKGGEKYQLLLEVKKFYFFYSFKINTPPLYGSFSVEPSEGQEFETNFVFRAKNWFDDEEDLPLRYSFAYGEQGNPAILRMSQAERYSTKLAWVENPSTICKIYDSLDDFTEITFKVIVKNQENLTKIIQKSLEKIEPPTSIPAVITNILTATLKNNKYSELYQDIYNQSARHLNDFIEISQPTDAFIDQSVNIMDLLTYKREVLDENEENVDMGMNVTQNILNKVEGVGVSQKQAEDLINVLQNLITITDDVITQGDEDLLKFTKTSNKINILHMRRLNYVTETIVSSKSVSTKINIQKAENMNDLKYSNDDLSFNISSILLENQENNTLIGIIHTFIKTKPSKKSHHQLVSLSLFENSNDFQEDPIHPKQIDVILEIPANFTSKDAKKGKCLYFDENDKEWSDKGCNKLKNNDGSVFCSCNHLTTFTFGFISVSLSLNRGVKEFTWVTFSLPGFVLPVVLFFAFLLTLIRAKIVKQVPSNNELTETNNPQKATSNKDYEQSSKNYKLSTINSTSNQLTFRIKHSQSSLDSNSLSEQSHSERFSHQSYFEIIAQDENLENPSMKSPRTINSKEEILGRIEEEKELDQYLSQLDFPRPPSPVQQTKLEKIKQKLTQALLFYNSHCHTIQIIFQNKSVPRKYFQITKIYFILFLEIMFDALFFDYRRDGNSQEFEKNLEQNFQSINIITVLFTAGLIFIAKIILFIIEVVPVKRKRKFRFIILPFVFVLCYGYFLYEVSCLSTAFGEEVSRVWLVCCLISIATEVTIFEPLGIMTTQFIKKKVEKNETYKKITRLKIFWRVFRCPGCKECGDCKNGDNCEVCRNCELCGQVVR